MHWPGLPPPPLNTTVNMGVREREEALQSETPFQRLPGRKWRGRRAAKRLRASSGVPSPMAASTVPPQMLESGLRVSTRTALRLAPLNCSLSPHKLLQGLLYDLLHQFLHCPSPSERSTFLSSKSISRRCLPTFARTACLINTPNYKLTLRFSSIDPIHFHALCPRQAT